MNFEDQYWHDSVLKTLVIDRTAPGINDILEIEIMWPDGSSSKIIFKDVFLFKATMNFGIVAAETIDHAFIASDTDDDLLAFYKKWKGLYDHFKVNCYVIKLLSTGGELKILAQEVIMQAV